MRQTALLIMAAGIGSRYGGGIKQLASVDSGNHIIMDYSIHDAIQAGFNHIIFVIRKDIEKDFKEVIGNRIESVCSSHNVKVSYCFQDLNDVPEIAEIPEGRTKPWGTGQAVLAAKDLLTTPFAVINADDYYGKEAFVQMHDWLVESHLGNSFAMAGFVLKNTLSENGGVTRGICKLDQGHSHILDVNETKNIIKTADGAEADGVTLDPDSYVSMNFWGFPTRNGEAPMFLKILEYGFDIFFRRQVPADPLKAEFLLPNIIGGLLRADLCTVKVLPTHDKWFGVTYAEDKASVTESFQKLIKDGVYSEDLYSDLA